MNREQYLQSLRGRLSNRLPPQELENMMNYYSEYFEEAGPEREAEVMEELGSPADLVCHIMGEQVIRDLDEFPPDQPQKSGLGAVWTVILAICAAPIAIPLMVALVVLGAAMVCAVIVFEAGIAVAGIICVGVGIVLAVAGFSVILGEGIATTMYFVGGGMLTAGIGCLLVAGTFFLAGVCFRGIVRLLGRALRRGERMA